jgi:membrane fusion protein (multidrug efflux system)
MPYDDPHGRSPSAPRQEVGSDPPAPRGEDRGGAEAGTTGRRSPLVWIILGLIVLAAAGGGGWYWYATRNQVSTDDAYTDGVAVTIAPKISGYVSELLVTDNQFVRAGEVLLRIDPRDQLATRDQAAGRLAAVEAQLQSARAALDLARLVYPARLAAARAMRDSAQAVLVRAEADLRRQQGLPKAATTKTALDESTAGAAQARAQLAEAEAGIRQAEPVEVYVAEAEAKVHELEGERAQAQAQLRQGEVNLGYTTLTAAQDGWVTKRNVERGTYVNAGGSLMSLVSPKVWVTANFKESQLDRMRPGQTVRIEVDAYPGLKLLGHVDSIQKGSGARFSAFPAENATGNFVKIVQRLPVKIVIDSGLDPAIPLPLGLSVVPTVLLE